MRYLTILSILAVTILASVISSPVGPVTEARADLALLSNHKNGDELETGSLTSRSVSADLNAQLLGSIISASLGGNTSIQISTTGLVNALAGLSFNIPLGEVLQMSNLL